MSIQYFETLLNESTIVNTAGWLRGLSEKERKSLGKDLKALTKVYTEYKEVHNPDGSFTFKQKATGDQQKVLVLANFVCLSRSEFEKSNFPGWIFDQTIMDHVIDWHHPDWLGDFAENLVQKNQVFYSVNYLYLAELEQKGYINLQPGLVCQTLVKAVYEQSEGYKFIYKPYNLFKFPNTLSKHIWWLFHYESHIYYANRWIQITDGGENDKHSWIELFKQFINEGLLERRRILQEALLGANRNFNKLLSGWFIDLAEALNPTDEELLYFQPSIFSLLNAPHSRPVNYAINVFKKIAGHADFDGAQFLDNASTTMVSPTKSIVAGTITVFEKMLKTNRGLVENTLQVAVNGFIQQDTALQTKVAKLIDKFGIGFERSLSEALQPYKDNILSEAKEILKPYLHKEDTISFGHEIAEELPISGKQERIWEPIPTFENFDDLLFLCSRAFESNEAWYADVLPSALVQNQKTITEQNADSFSPALKRAFQLTYTSPSFNTGIMELMLMKFFIDICIIIIRRYPNHTKTLQSLLQANEEKYQKQGFQWLKLDERTSYSERYPLSNYNEFYRLYQRKLVLALHLFKNKSNLPMLSTPSLQPAWIDPETFIYRLLEYEKADIYPDILDFQMGMARCNLTMVTKVEPIINQVIHPETKGLMCFLFGFQDQPDKKMARPELWFMASLCKTEKKKYEAFEPYGYYQLPFATYTGDYDFQIAPDADYSRFLSFLPTGEKSQPPPNTFQIFSPKEDEKEVGMLQKIKDRFTTTRPKERVLPEYFRLNERYRGQTTNDFKKALLISPNNMGPLLASIAGQSLKYDTFPEATDSHAVQATIEVLHSTGCISGKMAHVFIATTMICSNKNSSGVAAEIWIEGVQNDTMDSVLLGMVLGRHYRVDYAPLKRLTDLMQARMFNLSPLHNKALLSLIENMLPEFPDTPPANLKRLLLLYNELLHITHVNRIIDSIHSRLANWIKTKSLEPIIKTLLRLNEST